MFNSEKLPYSADVYGRELRQGDCREDRRSLLKPILNFRQDIIEAEGYWIPGFAGIGWWKLQKL
jgi:hypothetical protein